MSRMPNSDDPKYKLEFKYNKPEENPQRLAIQLAEAFTIAATCQQDCESFKASAQAERTKAKDLQNIIFLSSEIKKRSINI